MPSYKTEMEFELKDFNADKAKLNESAGRDYSSLNEDEKDFFL